VAPTVNLAALAARQCPQARLAPEAANLNAIREAVLCLVNRERARAGVAPLVVDRQLQAAAQGHSADMVRHDYFEHVSPQGQTPVDRIRSTGYIARAKAGFAVGENIAWGTESLATPQEIVASWMASAGHRANILDPVYRETGVGMVAGLPASMGEGEPGAMYTQDFGALTSG
jgi:uncharacterized protein YkwD